MIVFICAHVRISISTYILTSTVIYLPYRLTSSDATRRCVFVYVGGWVEKRQRFLFNVTNVFFIFVPFLRFLTFLIFSWNVFYIYGWIRALNPCPSVPHFAQAGDAPARPSYTRRWVNSVLSWCLYWKIRTTAGLNCGAVTRSARHTKRSTTLSRGRMSVAYWAFTRYDRRNDWSARPRLRPTGRSDPSDRPVGQTVAEPPTSVNQINVAC